MNETLMDETEDKTVELFLKYAFCKKCKKKANYCDCDIGEPIMMLAQFYDYIKGER